MNQRLDSPPALWEPMARLTAILDADTRITLVRALTEAREPTVTGAETCHVDS